MNLSQSFASNYFVFFENFVSLCEPLINSWFDVPTNHMFMFILFVSASVFLGCISPVSILNLETQIRDLVKQPEHPKIIKTWNTDIPNFANYLVFVKFIRVWLVTVHLCGWYRLHSKLWEIKKKYFFFHFSSPLMYNHTTSTQLYYKYLQNLQRLHARYAQSAKTTELSLRNTARKTLDKNAVLAYLTNPMRLSAD